MFLKMRKVRMNTILDLGILDNCWHSILSLVLLVNLLTHAFISAAYVLQ
jgi:hypothetical protein